MIHDCAGPPDVPKHCHLLNQTSSSVHVSCVPGYNGGLSQQLHLELFTSTKLCVANMTGHINITEDDQAVDVSEEKEIFFSVSDLPADHQFKIVYYSSNQKGNSVKKYLKASTLPMVSGEKGRLKQKYLIIN